MALRTVTVKTSGGDYTTLSGAEAGEQGDMVALDRQLDIECHAVADTTACTFSGWTTDATRYIRVYAAVEHDGIWSAGVYSLSTSGTPASLIVQANYINFEGIQIDLSYTGATAAQTISYNAITGAGVSGVTKCLIRRGAAATGGSQYGVRINDADWTVNVANCVLWWVGTPLSSASAFVITAGNPGTLRCYNNTVVGWSVGPNRLDGTMLVKNTLVSSATTAYSGTMAAGSNYNASSTAAATGGANDRVSQTFTFVNAGANDYHLDAADAGAKGFGTDLSADATYPISVDVDNVTRTGTWDIGADQTVSATAKQRLIGGNLINRSITAGRLVA